MTVRFFVTLLLAISIVALHVNAQNDTDDTSALLNSSQVGDTLAGVTTSDCFAGATGLFTCGNNETECTCLKEIIDREDKVADIVNRDSTCEVMSTEICGLIDRVRECCEPCLKYISELAVCNNDFLKTNNCTEAQQCAAQGVADGALSFHQTSSFVTLIMGTVIAYWML